MKAHALAAALALLATSCSHARPESPRAPSSANMEVSFDEILARPDPRADAKAFVGRLLVIELRAHGWMIETDRVFEQANGPVDLFTLPSYRKLLVARPLVERIQHQIVDFYAAAAAAARGSDAERAAKAKQVVTGVHEALLHANRAPAERVLLNDLLRGLREAVGKAAHPVIAPLEGEALYAAAAAADPKIRGAIEALPATDDVKEEIEGQEQEMARDLEVNEGREPNAVNVFPSAGHNGNIDGFTFPRGAWAVTFDDGPDARLTDQHLANLVANRTKATFFWLAKNVQLYPQIVKRVQAAGMPVENHSWSHAQLNSAKDLARLHTTLDKEINQSTAVDTKFYGAKPRFFRCPYGAGFNDPGIRGMIARQGMIHVRWNVDSLDWKDNNPATVQARVEQQMRANGRGIILFHDIHTAALRVVPSLFAKNKGQVRWVSIPQIVDELNGGAPLPDASAPGAPAAENPR